MFVALYTRAYNDDVVAIAFMSPVSRLILTRS